MKKTDIVQISIEREDFGWLKDFPKDFIWGAASSAYQVEGAYNEDGKSPSIWDTFSNITGNITHDETGNVACDHYHRYKEDIDLMKELGITAYRLSISWPRIFPEGRTDHINQAGVKFYDDLVDYCLKQGIQPIITLFHWDLPQILEDQGGWFNPQNITYFAAYAAWVCAHFSDRVTSFCTINEPQIISGLGYYLGLHAPGKHLDKTQIIELVHQLARAHSHAVTAMRANAKQPIKIGFASTGNLCYPSEHVPTAISAAWQATFTTTEENWMFCHQIFCDAVILGKSADLSAIGIAPWTDCKELCPPIDFLGVNIYNGHEVDANGEPVPRPAGFPRTALKWPITPEVMRYGTQFLFERYGLPIIICENGLSCNDLISLDGQVHDRNRIDFLTRYLQELGNSIADGIPVIGYLHWSFTDNFEWHSGYDERFGLVYVDYVSQERTPKDSFWWYQQLIKASHADSYL